MRAAKDYDIHVPALHRIRLRSTPAANRWPNQLAMATVIIIMLTRVILIFTMAFTLEKPVSCIISTSLMNSVRAGATFILVEIVDTAPAGGHAIMERFSGYSPA